MKALREQKVVTVGLFCEEYLRNQGMIIRLRVKSIMSKKVSQSDQVWFAAL